MPLPLGMAIKTSSAFQQQTTDTTATSLFRAATCLLSGLHTVPELPIQDSNQDCVDQTHECCHYTKRHIGLAHRSDSTGSSHEENVGQCEQEQKAAFRIS